MQSYLTGDWMLNFKLNKRQSDLLKSANKSSLFKKKHLLITMCQFVFLIYKKSDNILFFLFFDNTL